VLIQGYGYYRTFLKGLIDKLGIDVHVFRAGEFKSYTEQFSRTNMSEEDREGSLKWLNALWSQYQAGIARARGSEAPSVGDYANEFGAEAKTHAGDLAQIAVQRGLVTGLKTRREVEEQLKALVGEDEDKHTFRHVTHWDYLAATRATKIPRARDRVGVVVLAGQILDGSHPPGTIGSESAARLLRQALDDDAV